MSKITHLEIHADDTDRAVEFYREVFGWMIHPKAAGDEEYWLIFNASEGGISGGVRPRLSPKVRMVPQIQVNSIDEAIAKVTQYGGKVSQPKKTLPGTGYLVYCEDTEGNAFALLEKNFEVK